MRHVLTQSILTVICLIALGLPDAWADCSCPVVSCGSCEDEAGLDFYTQKCDAALISCTRPLCVPARFPSKKCVSMSAPKASRLPASTSQPLEPGQVITKIGKVMKIHGKGQAFRVTPAGSKKSLFKSSQIYTGDTLVTDSKARIQIQLEDRNQIEVFESTRLLLSYYEPVTKKHPYGRVAFDLIAGRVRSQVKEAYLDNPQSHFWVMTENAVVRVLGTDFEVGFAQKGGYETEVKVYKGEVEFSSPAGTISELVKANQRRKYVVRRAGDFDANELHRMLESGHFSPLFEMKKPNRTLARALPQKMTLQKHVVCKAPEADFNQCAWSCLNNPEGENVCRTDVADVKCVRARCDANGSWVEPTRLPASHFEKCPAQGVKVRGCDY